MRVRHLALLALTCIPFLFLIPKGARAVQQDNLILSSAVEGLILDHGKPVAGLKIQRIISWNIEAGPRTEITSTNKDGRFQFQWLLKMTHSSSWSDFAPIPNVLSSHADLAKDFATIGGGNMFNTKLLELIGKLTRRVLLDMGYVALVTTQGALSMAFAAVDLLAEVLVKAANASKLLADDVHTIVNSMLGFLGRPVMNGTDITVSTLHWIFGQFSTEMAGRAEPAMLRAQKLS